MGAMCVRDDARPKHSAHPTNCFNIPLSAKKRFCLATGIEDSHTPSPLCSMLVVRRLGGLPAKKRFPFCAGVVAPPSPQH